MTLLTRVRSTWARWLAIIAPDSTPSASGEAARIDAYMTVRDVATLFKVHPETVRRLTRERLLTGHSIGGQWRYKREEVEEDARRWGEHRRVFYARSAPDRRRAASYKRKRIS